MGLSRQEHWSGYHSLLQWTTFCQNSPWPVCLEWPCMAWLIVSLTYTRLWSMWSFWLIFCACGFHFVCPLMDEDKRLVQVSWYLKAQHSENEDQGILFHPFMPQKWKKNGNSDRFIFLGSKITVDGDCSHEIKRCLLLGRKAMANVESLLKSRDITLPTKVHLVKAIVFPVVMYGCEIWTIEKAEHWRIDAFELWC